MTASLCDEGAILNKGVSHFNRDRNGPVEPAILEAINYLLGLGRNRHLDDKATAAIDLIASSGCCLSPNLFHSKLGGFTNAEVVVRLVKASSFGRKLVATLRKVGLFSFLNLATDPIKSERLLHRVLAVACFSSAAPSRSEHHLSDLMIAVLDWYRTGDGLRFRAEIWGADEVGPQCVREFARACHRKFGDAAFLSKAVNTRRTYGGSRTWAEIERNATANERQLLSLIEKFRAHEGIGRHNTQQLAMDLLNWLNTDCQGASIKDLIFGSQTKGKRFSAYLCDRRGNATDHVLNQVNRAIRFSQFALEQFQTRAAGRVLVDLVDPDESDWTRKKRGRRSTTKKHIESTSNPLPSFLFDLALELLQEGESGWPGRCGYFNERVLVNGEMRSIYCPVMPSLLLALMFLPLRQAQMKRLDSGEGDTMMFNGDTLTWSANDSVHAGYWKRKARGTKVKHVPHFGYAKRYEHVVPEITGFSVTTNKTGDPYDIPWQHQELHKLLWQLRTWQQTYNPVSEPTPPEKYVDDEEKLTRSALEKMPPAFLLFRMPASSRSKRYNQPPSSSVLSKAWAFVMSEVERRWNAANPEHKAHFVSYQQRTGQPQASDYNLHGLRARGLTILHEQNVPIEIISKVVAGHASVMMTIYYLLFHPSRINELLEKSRVEGRVSRQDAIIRDMKVFGVEQARRNTTSIENDAVEAAVNVANKLPCSHVGIGFCPFSGTRCSDGRLLEGGSGRGKRYTFPEGGARNCIMCRHFVTGPAWIEELIFFGRLLYVRRENACERRTGLQNEINVLSEQKKRGEITREYQHATSQVLYNRIDEIGAEIELLDRASFNVQRLVTACFAILEEDEHQLLSEPSLIASDLTSMEEYISPMEDANALALAARWYPLLLDEKVESSSRRYLDLVTNWAGQMPLSLMDDVSEPQRQRAYDDLRRLMAAGLSRQDMTAISEGKLRVRDVQLDKQVRDLIQQSIITAVETARLPRKAQARVGIATA